MARYWCGSCEREIDRDDEQCPSCGSPDRAIEATAEAAIGLEFGVKAKARYGNPDEVRPHREQSSKVVWSHDRQREERRTIIVDRENDHYRQEWRTLDTDEVTYEKEGRLSDPGVHGESARRGKAQDAP